MVEFVSKVNVPDPDYPGQRIIGYRIKCDDLPLVMQLAAIPDIQNGQLIQPNMDSSATSLEPVEKPTNPGCAASNLAKDGCITSTAQKGQGLGTHSAPEKGI